ncbi:type II toxin-antitoxin system RelE/ParE family toxin [Paeniglutamicibacter gangotriensis]|uniref:Type II toxin-antitoxin system RelE/ParE family toxin n=1 Tax=Paeniglutamicibacter gangotriensis TaxID=254787 RepID=A0A5B0EIC8_9MICC|nr:type II toxin-antitoxin system RelE/ParE family toxin [Paeniglutamicibacter gangotriensis]KAA0978663.1 type II toxin-antitoxin system RelE/ParE family toxin [Paeniglutamicibacter gangotriensis]
MTGLWHLETTSEFDKELRKLDRPLQRRVVASLEEVATLKDPRSRGTSLIANHRGVWRCRIGDHRVLAQIIDDKLVILALKVGHGSRTY